MISLSELHSNLLLGRFFYFWTFNRIEIGFHNEVNITIVWIHPERFTKLSVKHNSSTSLEVLAMSK